MEKVDKQSMENFTKIFNHSDESWIGRQFKSNLISAPKLAVY